VNERILVTGASGFVGCRVAEHLVLARGAAVRGTYHRAARAARVAHLPIELTRLDLADERSIAAAVEGCTAVVHCAYSYGRDLTGTATGRVAEAARRAGVERFVHLSSVAVWGFDPGPGEVDESRPPALAGHPYVDGKIDSEQQVDAAATRGLQTVVLRPTNVYGPWSAIWTEAPARTLQAGEVALVGDGSTLANTVYVDNLVSAIALALDDPRLVGGTFVVNDDDGLTWRDLYDAYAHAAASPLTVRSVPFEEWRAAALQRGGVLRELRGLLRSPEAAALVRAAAARPALRRAGARAARVVPGGLDRARRIAAPGGPTSSSAGRAMALPSPELAAVQTSGASYRAARLRALGWEPAIGTARALALTQEWLRWARLL